MSQLGLLLEQVSLLQAEEVLDVPQATVPVICFCLELCVIPLIASDSHPSDEFDWNSSPVCR